MQGALLFAFVLSVLVVFHEWGHYYAAKRLGIGVEKFSIGFGPVLFKIKPKDTEFCLSLIPLGGYVKLAGESPEESTGKETEFHTRPNWHKFIVVFAGPLLNAVLAFLFFWVIFLVGYPSLQSSVGEVMEGLPAQKAGILAGDRIVSVNGQEARLWEDLLVQIRENQGDSLLVEVNRDGRVFEFDLLPSMQKSKDMFGREVTVPLIGIKPSGDTETIKTSFLESIQLAFMKVVKLTQLILTSLGMLVTGAISFKDSMAGPVGIYVMTQQAASVGWITLVDFMGRLSVSLFVINLLPIPVLDGGHLLFIILESIIRRPISDKIKENSLKIGFIFIIGLALFVIYQDLINFGIVDKLFSWIPK